MFHVNWVWGGLARGRPNLVHAGESHYEKKEKIEIVQQLSTWRQILWMTYCLSFLCCIKNYYKLGSFKTYTFIIAQFLLVRTLGMEWRGLLLRLSQGCSQGLASSGFSSKSWPEKDLLLRSPRVLIEFIFLQL